MKLAAKMKTYRLVLGWLIGSSRICLESFILLMKEMMGRFEKQNSVVQEQS